MIHSKRSYRKGNPRGTKSKLNARKFHKYDQMAIRRHAIRLYEQEKLSSEEIAVALGLSVRSVYRWISWFKSKGWDAFRLPEPRRTGKLAQEQIAEIVQMVIVHTPSNFGYDTNLWTRKIISEEIYKRFQVSLSETTVGRILKRNKVTPQKPIRRAYQQNQDVVNYFKMIIFPELVQKAKAEGAIILWLDETQACMDPNVGRTWGERGKTPIIPGNGQKKKINVLGSLDQNGRSLFMTYSCNTDSKVIISFIDYLSKQYKEKIYIILDNARYHTSKELKAHIGTAHAGWLELVYLPPYSPELNPTELIWAHLKSHGLNRVITKTKELFEKTVDNHLIHFSTHKTLGKSVFGKKELAYIVGQFPDLLKRE